MFIRENIQVFHPLPIDSYLDVLRDDHGREKHPQQPGAYVVDGLPFYQPQHSEGYVFTLWFNLVPLSQKLIQVLVDHPELVPGSANIRWTQEQDLDAEGALSEFSRLLHGCARIIL